MTQPPVPTTDAPDAPLDRTIATLVHLVGRRRLDLDVLIRGDGCPGGLELRGFPLLRAATPDGPAVLVDLDDRMDPRAVRDTRDRMASYEARGWSIDPV